MRKYKQVDGAVLYIDGPGTVKDGVMLEESVVARLPAVKTTAEQRLESKLRSEIGKINEQLEEE